MTRLQGILAILFIAALPAHAETYLICEGLIRVTYGENYSEMPFRGEVTLVLSDDHVSMSDYGNVKFSHKGDQVWEWVREINDSESGLWNLNIVSGHLSLVKTVGGEIGEEGARATEQLEYRCRKTDGLILD